ncbi:unnamed protein product [Dovyalis caffra]|uniref:RING-type domain-containing protein n=1 Tax=Dovyalis caffra TaxID=77055 RepID=A0AAV1SA87_9ROSI|nr:unnamed protein product [Dovyalis caffra]
MEEEQNTASPSHTSTEKQQPVKLETQYGLFVQFATQSKRLLMFAIAVVSRWVNIFVIFVNSMMMIRANSSSIVMDVGSVDLVAVKTFFTVRNVIPSFQFSCNAKLYASHIELGCGPVAWMHTVPLEPEFGKAGVPIGHCFLFSNDFKRTGSCYQVVLRDNHSCVENAMKNYCPVCYEYLFYSVKKVIVMKCGHTMHMECFDEMAKQQQYRCPICSKTVMKASAYWQMLDEEV